MSVGVDPTVVVSASVWNGMSMVAQLGQLSVWIQIIQQHQKLNELCLPYLCRLGVLSSCTL